LFERKPRNYEKNREIQMGLCKTLNAVRNVKVPKTGTFLNFLKGVFFSINAKNTNVKCIILRFLS
jgi:hypothetical protein